MRVPFSGFQPVSSNCGPRAPPPCVSLMVVNASVLMVLAKNGTKMRNSSNPKFLAGDLSNIILGAWRRQNSRLQIDEHLIKS